MHELILAPGEGVFLFTDGVTEANDPAGADYGDARLRAMLEKQGERAAEALVRAVAADVDRFANGAAQADDIACLALVFRGEG